MRPLALALFFALLGGARVEAVEPIPDKLVVLTFDDASRSHAEFVAPLLKKHGFSATFFVTEGFDMVSNKRDYMTWDEIARLHRDGFEIGNHTKDHKAPSSKDIPGTIAQLEAIDARCAEHGIPRPISFAYPGNALDREVLPILRRQGIKFARRGGAPEYSYDKGQGFAYEPGLDHSLLIPSAGDARPAWTLEDFKRAVGQAKGGKIAVIQLHGVPDTAHSWVNTPKPLFESYVRYLAEHGFKVIAMRDLARYVDPTVEPKNPWGVIEARKKRLAAGEAWSNERKPTTADELKTWLASMLVFHGYSREEAGIAVGLSAADVAIEVKRLKIDPESVGVRPTLLPYPGGRHPRIGFLDGAIFPQRETKVSVFPPWADGGYAVVDLPEAVWHKTNKGERKLLYLAHTHIPTLWDEQGVTLPPQEWRRTAGGGLELTRILPNKVSMTTRAEPFGSGIAMEFQISNGSADLIRGIDVQMCVMLRSLNGFAGRTNDNKVFSPPFSAAHDANGDRWVIAAWENCRRAWGNPPCPCLHSDPQVADCPPGESRNVRGWIFFYHGNDIRTEFQRLARAHFARE